MRPPQVQLCHQAASAGNLEGVKEQFQQLFDSSRVPSAWEKPNPAWLYDSLSIAIQRNHVEIVQYLLDQNVHNDDLPAELAVRARAFETLKLFLDRGWDVNKPMGPNEPPILGYDLQSLTTSDTYLPFSSIALSTSDADMIVWLLDHGADPNRGCDWDLTPTSYAMTEAPFDIIEYLFSRGANLSSGQLLHHAVLRKKPDALRIVRWLIDNGAPINAIKYSNDPKVYAERKSYGLGTPLHRAAESGEVEIVKYLLSMGANARTLDSKGYTPRFWAEQRGNVEVVDILKKAENIRP
jgi:ankyrin repeat protein